MSKTYTLSELNKQRSKVQDMVLGLIANVQSANHTAGTMGSFTFVIDDTMFLWQIRFIEKPNKEDLSGKTIVEAKLKLGEGYFSINFESGDFFSPGITGDMFELLTEGLINNLAVHMARTWYAKEGMQKHIAKLAQHKQFGAIVDYVGSNLALHYNDQGYSVIIYTPDGDMLSTDIHESAPSIRANPDNTNFDKFLRYLDDGIVLLLASERIWKDKWSTQLTQGKQNA